MKLRTVALLTAGLISASVIAAPNAKLNAWKQKQTSKQYELKITKNKLNSVLDSRGRWKSSSRETEKELAELKHRISQKNREIEEYRAQIELLARENEELKKNR